MAGYSLERFLWNSDWETLSQLGPETSQWGGGGGGVEGRDCPIWPAASPLGPASSRIWNLGSEFIFNWNQSSLLWTSAGSTRTGGGPRPPNKKWPVFRSWELELEQSPLPTQRGPQPPTKNGLCFGAGTWSSSRGGLGERVKEGWGWGRGVWTP